MKAMIFAAGLGTRLNAHTHSMPKALVLVNEVPMLELLIRHMSKQGIQEIIINTHHFSKQIVDFIQSNNGFSCNISISNESESLLETGGGLQKALWFFDDNAPFLVQNVDILSDICYSDIEKKHKANKSIATLAVSKRKSSRYFLFDGDMRLCGWENVNTGEVKLAVKTNANLSRYAFSGIHIINPEIFDTLTLSGKFSMVDAYLALAAHQKIYGFLHEAAKWVDMGKPENILEAEALLLQIPDYY